MSLIDKYIGEAKKKSGAIPRVKGGKGRYHFGIKFDPNGWYQKPEMAGHNWAKESLDALENVINTYSKTALQKWVIEFAYGTPQEMKKEKQSWHFFANNVTKKDIATLQFVLRRVDKAKKGGMYALKSNVDRKSSLLKDRLTWALELLSYKHDKEAYLKGYIQAYGFYGMEPKEAQERFEKYHDGIRKKAGVTKIP